MSNQEAAFWLRPQLEADLARWRDREISYARNVEREGEVLWHEARERVAHLEAMLAILDEHASDGDERWPQCVRCADLHPERCECGVLDGRHWRTAEDYPCRTVRFLLMAYRFRLGYREEWAP